MSYELWIYEFFVQSFLRMIFVFSRLFYITHELIGVKKEFHGEKDYAVRADYVDCNRESRVWDLEN